MIILALLAQALWALGYADQAQAAESGSGGPGPADRAYPQSGVCGIFAARLCQYRRDAAATQAHADAMMALAAAHGFGHRIAHGRMLRGWALAMQGDTATGVSHIRQGLAAFQGTGPKLWRPYYLALLAEASGQAGQPEAGLTVLAEA